MTNIKYIKIRGRILRIMKGKDSESDWVFIRFYPRTKGNYAEDLVEDIKHDKQ